jgi:hypothetical protein
MNPNEYVWHASSYKRLTEEEFSDAMSGKAKIVYGSDVPGYAAFYAHYLDRNGNQSLRIVTYLEYVELTGDNEL